MIPVTGSTGNLGSGLLSILQQENIPYKAAVHKTRELSSTQVVLDFENPETFESALEGVKKLFLVRPPAIANIKTTIGPFLETAAKMGVEFVVFVSVSGAEHNKMVPHHKIEQRLHQGSIPYSILRPGFFAQNLGGPYRKDLVEQSRFFLPVGSAQGSFIDTRDIAMVAHKLFLAPAQHSRTHYTLTGQELLSFDDIASLLSDELQREISYEPCSTWSYFWHLRGKHGLSWMQCVVQTLLHLQFSTGGAAVIDPALPQLLGRPALTMKEYIKVHKELWSKPWCLDNLTIYGELKW